jgi:hypothetical protein
LLRIASDLRPRGRRQTKTVTAGFSVCPTGPGVNPRVDTVYVAHTNNRVKAGQRATNKAVTRVRVTRNSFEVTVIPRTSAAYVTSQSEVSCP